MDRKELLKSKEYWLSEIQLNLFNLIENYRKDNKMNKTQLADMLGVTKGYISQIMNGDFDHKISKLVALSLAFGKVPIVQYKELEDVFVEDNFFRLSNTWTFQLTQEFTVDIKSVFRNIDEVDNKKLHHSPPLLSQLIENSSLPNVADNSKKFAYEG